jgi:type III secretion system FlhB-like substrate exporter
MKKNITTLTYFDLFENYPIIKTSSKRDSFVKMAKESEIEVIQNEDLVKKLENIQTIY